MKAVLFASHGGPEVLRFEEIPTPVPGPGEVQVKLAAASLNHLDLWVRNGLPTLHIPLPHVSGSDGAGVISAVGPGAGPIAEGDRVVVNPVLSCGRCIQCLSGRDNLCPKFALLGEHRHGCLAEYVVVPAQNVVAAPKGFDLTHLAALPVTYMTAWQMLVDKAQVQPGELVLVLGVGSGIGIAALQIAKLHGAIVVGTASSAEKLERARKLGADFVINHATQDLVAATKQISPRGVDVVVEHVGQVTWEKSIRVCTTGGRIVTCGATTGWDARTNLSHVFYRQLTIHGSTMAPKGRLHAVVEQVAAGRLAPIIDRTYPLSQAKEAEERLARREQFGKIILLP